MALREPSHRPQKTMAEGYACFVCALTILAAAAIALKWMMNLLP